MRILFAIVLLAMGGQTITDTGTIEGFIRRQGSLEPIPDVQVILTQSSVANAAGTTTTDGQGRYIFRNVVPGQYAVVARHDGYFGPGNRISPTPPVIVTVEKQQRLVDITVFMVPIGTISGRIRGPNGQFLPGVQVEAVELSYDRIEVIVETPGGVIEGVVVDGQQKPVGGASVAVVPQERRQTSALYKLATTDKDGRFTVRAIAPGNYKLFAMETTSLDMWMNPDFRATYEMQGMAITVAVGASGNLRLTLIPE